MTKKRLSIALVAIPICLASLVVVGAQISHPASASGVIDPTCTSSLPCIEYDNDSTGPGIRGISLVGNGLSGSTKNKSTSATNGRAGLMGNDVGTGIFNSGVHGLSVSGTGVSGQSTSSLGVSGISTSGSGVFGMSSGSIGAGVLGSSPVFVGVEGNTGATSGSSGRAAIEGTNNNTSIAIRANGFGGPLFVGNNNAGTDVFAVNDDGLLSVHSVTDTAIFGESDASAFNGVAGLQGSTDPTSIAILAAGSGGLLYGTSNSIREDVFHVDDSGNVHAHSFSSDLALSAKTRVVTYAPQASEPTVEDFGEAQLTNGSAYVRLESRFAATMARGLSYLVFVTPEGDSHGLYVAHKSVQGFAVRENGGGHSTIAFSYRIVAKPIGAQQPRLPLIAVRTVPRRLPFTPGSAPALRGKKTPGPMSH